MLTVCEVIEATNKIPRDEVKKFRNGCKEAKKDLLSGRFSDHSLVLIPV